MPSMPIRLDDLNEPGPPNAMSKSRFKWMTL